MFHALNPPKNFEWPKKKHDFRQPISKAKAEELMNARDYEEQQLVTTPIMRDVLHKLSIVLCEEFDQDINLLPPYSETQRLWELFEKKKKDDDKIIMLETYEELGIDPAMLTKACYDVEMTQEELDELQAFVDTGHYYHSWLAIQSPKKYPLFLALEFDSEWPDKYSGTTYITQRYECLSVQYFQAKKFTLGLEDAESAGLTWRDTIAPDAEMLKLILNILKSHHNKDNKSSSFPKWKNVLKYIKLQENRGIDIRFDFVKLKKLFARHNKNKTAKRKIQSS